MGKKCNISTKEIRDMASQLGIKPSALVSKIGVWKEKNNTNDMPTFEDMQKYLSEDNTEVTNNIPKVEIYIGYWTRAGVENATDKVFLFGDNTDDRVYTHHVPSSTQAVIRGLSNAIGIDTKRDRGTYEAKGVVPEGFELKKDPEYGDVLWFKTPNDRHNNEIGIAYKGSFFYEISRTMSSLTDEYELNWHIIDSANVPKIIKNYFTGDYSEKGSYFTDADFDRFKAQVDEAIQRAIDSGKTIVLPSDGIGTGKAQLKERAPKLFAYLQEQLEALKEIPQISKFNPAEPEISKDAITESVVKLNMLFTPQQLVNRTKNVAFLFSNQIDALYNKKINTLKAEINKLPANSMDRFKATSELIKLEDSKTGRTTFVLEYVNINDVIENVKTSLVVTRDKLAKQEQTESVAYKLDQYNKMIDGIDYLMLQALSDIEANEGIRIIISQKKTALNENKLVGQQQAEDEDDSDDDVERVAAGNSGWSFKQREVDPHTSLTQNVRKILRQISMVGDNAKDDLGFQRYMDAEYVYATILNGCAWMIDANDFHKIERDSSGERTGEFSLPAIDALAAKYKWMGAVRNHLYADEDLVSEFYSCFRMDYIPYYMLSNGRFIPVNKEMHIANTLEAITKNYETGNTLHKNSIFDVSGNLNHENAKEGKRLVSQLSKNLNNDDWSSYDFETLKDVLNMLGINVDLSLEDFLSLSTDNADKNKENYLNISRLLSNASAIFNNLSEVNPGDHLIGYFDTEYTNIAKVIGGITMFNKHMTFRQGDKDYPAYATPNFATTQIKKLLSPDSDRRKQILNFYKQSSWYYGKQGWKNFMLNQFENNMALVDELRGGCLVNMNNIRVASERGGFDSLFEKTEAVPYESWTPAQIKHAFVTAYFNAGYSEKSNQQYGYYNFPIFADSTCTMFMKFLRFTENYQEKILPLLRQVVIQEFGRQKLVADRKGIAAPIANFDKNGDKFFFFHELNTYLSDVEHSTIAKYYQDIIREAKKNGNTDIEKAATNRLESLPEPNAEGIVKAPFKDVVKAYRRNKNAEAINSTIDSAILDIMNRQFQSFYSNNVQDNLPLIRSLVDSGIIPQTELDAAVEALLKGETLSASVTVTKEQVSDKKEEKKEETQYNTLEEALREYYWNNALMQTQIIELMTVDPAFYKFDGGIDFQKRFKEVFASGRKLDTNSKYGREFEKTIYLTDRITTSRVYDKIKEAFDWAVEQKHLTAEQRDDILAKYEEINNADAQAFRSLSSMRAVLDMAHVWTDQMETAYNSITSNTWDSQDISVIWQTLKPFMYTIIAKDDGLGGKQLVPHQNKNSEFLLLAAHMMVNAGTAQHTKMIALNKFMEANDIDVVMYESAVKAGCQNPIDINISIAKLNDIEDTLWGKIENEAKISLKDKYKEGRNKENFYKGTNTLLKNGTLTQKEYNDLMDSVEPSEEEILEVLENACYKTDTAGNRVENLDTIHVLPYSDYMIATPTPEHWIDSRVVDGSQKRNLLVADLPKDAKFIVNGIEMSTQDVIDLYNSLYIENLLDSYDEVKGELSDVKKLQESLLAQIKGNPKYPRDFVNVLALKETSVGKTDFTVPLDFPSIRNKVAELVLSKFKNKITKQKVKGGSCILVADTENKLNIVLEDGSYLNTEDKAAVENAKKRNLIKGFECYLPAWAKEFYAKYLKTVTKDGKTWQELDFEKLKEDAPELLYMSGIRIPTEDKYSMTPLIVKGFLPSQSGSAIMLPAEITTIVGADFDVDKMFIRVYNFELDENGKPKKVEYDYSKSPQEQTRAQRENALLDIELAILRNKQVAEALLNPGTFDPIKKESRIDQILGEKANNGRSLFNIWQEEHGIDYTDIDRTIDSINNSSLDKIKKFVDRFAEKRSLLSLDTFIYNHQQNMAGAGLIGMYANNTTGQAKMQTTNLSIADKYTFTIEGRKIKSLHDVSFKKNGIDKRISKICAYFSAASVDNVKDPCLRKLGQNLNTANIAAFMLRAGMDEQEIGLLFNQPYIKYSIDTVGKVPDAKGLKNQFEYLNRRYGTSFGEDEINELIHQHNFTIKELSRNIVKDSRYKFLQQREVDTLSKNEREDFVKSTMLALALFDNIRMLADQLRGSVQISRADSPNGALSTELHKANKQVKAVDVYMNNKDVIGWGIENITDIMNNKVISTKDSRATMRKKLLSSDVKVPRLQAFYSLGIELAIDLIAPYFMSQSSACQSIVEEIENNVYRKLNDDALKTLYEDFTTYVLSGTEEFGDSDEGSFENKRDYYLYQYPRKLDEILKKNPALAKTPALAMLRVTSGEIVAERSGRLTPTVRDAATQSFDSLLFGSDKEGINVARDLFRYAYYNEGFNFRHNSYGQFFSANFLSSFEETVLSALRTTPDARIMKNFFEQWVAQKNNKVFFKNVSEGADVTNAGDNEIIIGLKSVEYNDKIKTAEGKATPWNYIVYKDELYAFGGAEELGVRYSKVSEINAGPTDLHKFNQKKTAEEVAAAKVDQDKVESLKEFNTASIKQQKAARRSELDNLINAVENTADEERFAEELESQESFFNDDSDFIMEWTDREDYLAFAEQAQQEEYDESLGQITLVENGGKPLC